MDYNSSARMKGQKNNNIFLLHRQHQNFFIAFPVFTLKNQPYITKISKIESPFSLFMVGWLHSGTPTLLIRHHCLKFSWTIVGTLLVLAKVKKEKKSHPPTSFLKKIIYIN